MIKRDAFVLKIGKNNLLIKAFFYFSKKFNNFW